MGTYVSEGPLQVDELLHDFIQQHVLPDSGVDAAQFWPELADVIREFTPENVRLLEQRESMQRQMNDWHTEHPGPVDLQAYTSFLERIGYLEADVDDFDIQSKHVDDEIAYQAGPQLVVPLNNARYALNAANARWGSLYDALYGTDAIAETDGAERQSTYNPVRGEKVVAAAKAFLDRAVPLQNGLHHQATQYRIENGKLSVTLEDNQTTELADKEKFVGYRGHPAQPESILLCNNGLHIDLQFDRQHPIGKTDPAGIKDMEMESALTTIMDGEDSVAAVDAGDKVLVYRNWLGLMKGDLQATFQKEEQTMTRTLHPDRTYTSPSGHPIRLAARSLMLVRNVGHLMKTNVILDEHGNEVYEGIVDTVITSLIAKHDLLQNGRYRNSKQQSIYIVKPKMHGSREVAFANRLFNRVEDMLDLQRYTLKIGVMDEERRTSLNLKACIHAVKERVVFINTGFLDRTGDEIHTSMHAGPMIRKNDMKSATWLDCYEKSNVAVGLNSGFSGRAQIGKGMWAMPDQMAEMLAQKAGQLQAGANTAWVPSPTAATLHAMHYHEIDVSEVQRQRTQVHTDDRENMLHIPLESTPRWSREHIQQELDNNAQGILGYVVRWIQHGIGCSKVPNIDHIHLMEDRATLRISSQHMANWLFHGICTEGQVLETMKRMAKVVDEQNADDPSYVPMAPDYDRSIAFQAACDLVLKGKEQPNGYTEPILHRRRLQYKSIQEMK